MLDALASKFSGVFRSLSGRGRISEENIREAMREVRTALLEADVNFKVVKDFTDTVRREGDRPGGHQQPAAGAVDGEDRLRRAGQADGPGRHADLPRPAAADGHHDVRPAGLGQNDDLRQAREVPASARGTIRCWPRPTCSGPAAVEQLRVLGEQVGVPVYTDPTKVAPHGQVRQGRGGRGLPGGDRSRRRRPAATSSSSTPPAGCTSTTS